MLVIEDDAEMLTDLNMSIAGIGLTVEGAQDAAEGLALFERYLTEYQEHPDVVVTDLHMPGLLGTELAKGVKKLAPDARNSHQRLHHRRGQQYRLPHVDVVAEAVAHRGLAAALEAVDATPGVVSAAATAYPPLARAIMAAIASASPVTAHSCAASRSSRAGIPADLAMAERQGVQKFVKIPARSNCVAKQIVTAVNSWKPMPLTL